ncbi:3-hydroxyacyl-[acyl-carrier-protein] dehydratase FabZ [Spirochaetota bacterium]|nr:3-hydroxyacyl-[acyl-carrier-protein] dehydratase FabZ [Spirochaetota bacterium]
MEIEEIIKTLPHRYPFLMIDRVVHLDKDRIVAIKNVSANEPYFVGHFVEEKIMPGVLILETMAQASAIKAIKSRNLVNPSFYLLSITHAKFRHQVKPGDTLRIEALETHSSGTRLKFDCQAFVEKKMVSDVKFLAMFTDNAEPSSKPA